MNAIDKNVNQILQENKDLKKKNQELKHVMEVGDYYVVLRGFRYQPTAEKFSDKAQFETLCVPLSGNHINSADFNLWCSLPDLEKGPIARTTGMISQTYGIWFQKNWIDFLGYGNPKKNAERHVRLIRVNNLVNEIKSYAQDIAHLASKPKP